MPRAPGWPAFAGNVTWTSLGEAANEHAASPSKGYFYGGLGMTIDGASHVSAVTANLVDATHPASLISGATYSPLGDLQGATLASLYSQAFGYNPLGSTTAMQVHGASSSLLRSIQYSTDNLGVVRGINDATYGNYTFTYDHLTRLTGGSGQLYGIQYGYDNWGNLESRTATAGSAYQFSNTANLQNQVEYQYDPTGNVTADGVNSYSSDAENRIYVVSGKTQYYYDPEGRRVAKGAVGGSVATEYLYDFDGNLVTEVGASKLMQRAFIYAGGRHWADYTAGTDAGSGATEFQFGDTTGTFTTKYNQAGTMIESCASQPYGESLTCSGSTDYTELHFARKIRDQESSNDYFGARYFSSAVARFMSPDPLGGDLTNPQSLNRYSYVLNNPLTNTDPTGMYTCTDSKDCSSKKDQALEKSLAGLRNSKDADVARAANAYGAQNKDNGVSVGFADLSKSGEGGNTVSTIGVAADGSLRANSAITLNSKDGGADFTADVGHEGSHAADAQDAVKSGLTEDGQAIHAGMNITPYQSEQRACGVTNSILNSANESRNYVCGSGGCLLGRGASDIPGTVDRLVGGNAIYNQGGKPMSSTNQGPSVVNGVIPKATVPSVPH